jgi:ABC-2 type transport system permease protein
MTTDAIAEPALGSPPAATAAATSPRPFYWSVRRELWENRSIYIAPAVVAGVILLGHQISVLAVPRTWRATLALDPARQAAEIAMSYNFAAMAIIVTGLLVAMFYCLGALHGERRDRSILFWKSLPVSDLTAVLAKASVPLVVLPLVSFAIVVGLQFLMMLQTTVVLWLNGLNAGPLWTQLPFFDGSVVLLYGLTVVALWHAPIYGWLLLVSGWARRATFLWAVLPPLGLCLIEKMAFNTGYLGAILGARLTGGFDQAFTAREAGGFGGGTPPQVGLAQLDPLKFVSSPGLWIGLAVAAAFLAGAVWLRRNREPI